MNRWKTKDFVKRRELARVFQEMNQESDRRQEEILQKIQETRQEESEQIEKVSRDLRKLIEYMQQFNEEKWNRMQKTEENSQDKLEDMEKLIKMLLLNELSDDLEKGLKERKGVGGKYIHNE